MFYLLKKIPYYNFVYVYLSFEIEFFDNKIRTISLGPISRKKNTLAGFTPISRI